MPNAAHPPALHALIPCAGAGTRAGASGPKQYQPVAGRALIEHTLAAWAGVTEVRSVVVVVAADDGFFAHKALPDGRFFVAPCGGSTRATSVFNGLNWLLAHGAAAHDWVLVHDGARCLVEPRHIRALIAACEHDEVGGLLALPLPDTLKQEQGGRVVATLSRADKWLAQTPQMARIGTLLQALESAGDAVTDEASALEACGLSPRLVRGSAHNFKVTYPEDFALAEAVLQARVSG